MLEEYKLQKKTNSFTLEKLEFPKLLKHLFDKPVVKLMLSDNMKPGFASTGIYPYYPDHVLHKLPKSADSSGCSSVSSDVVVDLLIVKAKRPRKAEVGKLQFQLARV